MTGVPTQIFTPTKVGALFELPYSKRAPACMTDISAQIFMPMGIGALFEICHAQIGHWLKSSCVRVQVPPDGGWHLLFYL